jgi:HK97 family phage major capsid protein
MPWPFEDEHAAKGRELREELADLRKQSSAIADELVELADDTTDEGTTRFKELIGKRDQIDERIDAVDDAWREHMQKAVSTAGVRGVSRGLLAPNMAKSALRALGPDLRKALEQPAGAILVDGIYDPVVHAAPGPPALIWPRFAQRQVDGVGVVEFLQGSGPTPEAKPVKPLEQKPVGVLQITRASQPISVVAVVSEPLDKHVLEDALEIERFVGNTLALSCWRALDAECVDGDVATGGFPGILNTPGVLDVAWPGTGGNAADQVAVAIGVLGSDGYAADTVAMNPADWTTVRTSKAETAGVYLAAGITESDPMRLWGVPVVASSAVPAGTAIVGAFGVGGVLYRRTDARLSWAEAGPATELAAGADLFSRDAIRARVELRATLAVVEPGAFAKVDIAA